MPNNSNILPPDDRDLLLAKKIGNALPNIQSLDTEQDPLLSELFRYKRSLEETSFEPVNSVAIWDAIQKDLNTDSGNRGKILTFTSSFRRYAIAAALLLAAIVGSFLLQDLTSPALIGESFATIQQITLEDGTTISLRPYSRLYAIDESNAKMSFKLEGEAYFDVISDPQRVFSVETEQSRVEVLGTRFILSEWGNTSNVFLEEGKIRFEALGSRRSVILEPGQSSRIDAITTIPEVSLRDPAVYTDWLNSELIFNNDRVRDIFNELEQHFNIRIHSSDAIGNETLSGSIELDNIEAVLQDLALVLEGSFTQTDSNTYRFNTES